MRYFAMLPGEAASVLHPVWITSVLTVASDEAGVFYPLVARGARVAKDAPIGYVTDFFGKKVFEAKAPAGGEILYICSVPSMTRGGTIANIGVTE
jgi:predicted deacylase